MRQLKAGIRAHGRRDFSDLVERILEGRDIAAA